MTSTATTGTTGRSTDPKAKVNLHRGEFSNEAFIDFTKPENRKAMEDALAQVRAMFGREYPLTIGGERITTTEKIKSYNPSHPDQVIGVFQKATVEMANQAVEKAHVAFERWKRVPVEERVACLYRAADILRKRRYELDAWLSYEIGKTWPEADADIAELIDFCEYYGREALRLGAPQKLTPFHGENNYLKYIPLGVGIVIPPWNFAAAIMGGMTVAAIVTGNTVVVKPSSDSPTIAAIFIDILYESGLPGDVVSFFTGPGSTAGEALVTHPPDRKKRDCASLSRRRKLSRVKFGSSAPCWRWAARTPSSWTTKRTWTRRSKASRFRHSVIRDRSAQRVRGQSSRKKFTTSSWASSWSA